MRLLSFLAMSERRTKIARFANVLVVKTFQDTSVCRDTVDLRLVVANKIPTKGLIFVKMT